MGEMVQDASERGCWHYCIEGRCFSVFRVSEGHHDFPENSPYCSGQGETEPKSLVRGDCKHFLGRVPGIFGGQNVRWPCCAPTIGLKQAFTNTIASSVESEASRLDDSPNRASRAGLTKAGTSSKSCIGKKPSLVANLEAQKKRKKFEVEIESRRLDCQATLAPNQPSPPKPAVAASPGSPTRAPIININIPPVSASSPFLPSSHFMKTDLNA